MDECNSVKNDFHETSNIYPNLNANISNEQEFRINKIIEIKDYLLAEARERELISKNISKYIASLDYFDKSLNVFSTVIGALAGIRGASCGLTFSITSGFVKTFLKTIRNKKKKHNKIVMLATISCKTFEANSSFHEK